MPAANVRAVGAVFVSKPKDQFYGDRTYSAMDPHGHVWTFGQTGPMAVALRAPEQDSGNAGGGTMAGNLRGHATFRR